MNDVFDNSVATVVSNAGISFEIAKAYQSKGVKKLYDWQIECLYTTNVLNGSNLVYCAPTSGGKTLVSELVIFKTVLALKKQALFVLPYVSLVLEKERYFKSMARNFNRGQAPSQRISVRGFYGDLQQSKSFRESILICTIEKANGILNSLIQRGKYDCLGCVVLDEMHVLGNKFNGFLLEILISKLQYCSHQASVLDVSASSAAAVAAVPVKSHSKAPQTVAEKRASTFRKVQIIAMSATMGNVQSMADWLRAQLFLTDFRPVPLTEFIKAGNLMLNKQGQTLRTLPSNHIVNDPDHVVTLTEEALRKNQQVLIFCSSKLLCSQTCTTLAKFLPSNLPVMERTLSGRQELLTSLQEANGMMLASHPDMPQCILAGVAFHHAGLTSSERHLIESAYKSGVIVALCATSTLAAGVNLPAGCVLIRSMNLGRESLDVVHYRQMTGRAGRAGQSTSGESFLLVKSLETEKALHLANGVMPDVTSQLHPSRDGGNGLLKAAIELIGLSLVTTVQEYEVFVQQTLLYAESPMKAEAMDTAILSLRFLIDARIVDCSVPLVANQALPSTASLRLSRFGSAMLKSSLHPDEAIVIYESLSRAMDGLNSDCNLHLLYLVTPLDHAVLPDFKRLLAMYEHSIKHCTDNGKSLLGGTRYPVIANVFESVGVDLGVLHKWQFKAPTVAEIGMCNQAVKLYSLFTSNPGSSSGSSTEGGVKPSSKPSLLGFKSGGISKYDWKVLSYCKRISAALVLQSLMEGRPASVLSKEVGVSIQDIDALMRNARIMCGKVVKFCTEMGWGYLSKMIASFQSQIEGEAPKELKSLLSIPMMTRKIASVLVLNNISTVDQFLKCSVPTLARYLQLSIGFELQDLQAVEVELDAEDQGVTPASDGAAPLSSIYPTKQTRDEQTQITLLSLISKLMSNASELVARNNAIKENTANEYLTTLNLLDGVDDTVHGRPSTASSDGKTIQRTLTSAGDVSSDDNLSSSDEEETKSSVDSDDDEAMGAELEEGLDPETAETDRRNLLSGLQFAMKQQDALPRHPTTNALRRTGTAPTSTSASAAAAAFTKSHRDSPLVKALNHRPPVVSDPLPPRASPIVPSQSVVMDLDPSALYGSTTVVLQADFPLQTGRRSVDLVPLPKVDDFYSYGGISPVVGSEEMTAKPAAVLASPLLSSTVCPTAPSTAHSSALPPRHPRTSPSLLSELLVRNGTSPSMKSLSQSSAVSLDSSSRNSSINEITIRTSSPSTGGAAPDTVTTTTLTLSDEELMEMMENLENHGLLVACGDESGAHSVVPPSAPSSALTPGFSLPSQREVRPRFVKACDYSSFVYYPRVAAPEEQLQSHSTAMEEDPPVLELPAPAVPLVMPIASAAGNEARDRTSGFGLMPISPITSGFMYTCATKSTAKPANRRHPLQPWSVSAKKGGTGVGSANKNLLYSNSRVSSVHFSVNKKSIQPVVHFSGSSAMGGSSSSSSMSPVLPYSAAASSVQSACEDVLLLGKRKMDEESSAMSYFSRVEASDVSTPAVGAIKRRATGDVGIASVVSKPVLSSLSFQLPPSSVGGGSVSDSGALKTVRKPKSILKSSSVGVSPFSTPFTTSKLKTPGKYVYYPLFQSVPSIGDAASSSESSSSNVIRPLLSDPVGISSGFGVRLVSNPKHCHSFIERLRGCKWVSFELVFRELPSALLRGQAAQFYSSNSRSNALDPFESRSHTWWPLISSAFNKHTSVSAQSDDMPSMDAYLRMIREPPSKGDPPHVLVGIALSFSLSDEFSYYLPLPAPLPLTVSKPTPESLVNQLGKVTPSLNALPAGCQRLICQFVGFHLVLGKCPMLRRLMMSTPDRPDEGCCNQYELDSHLSNPLFLVNSHWCHVSRSALLDEWRKGGCIEWQVVNELMSNSKIAKVAADLKNKLVVLRERDVVVNGELMDPLVARQLIDQCTEEDCEVDFAIPSVNTFEALEAGEVRLIKENTTKIACFLSLSVLRVMQSLESALIENRLIDLFRNIEMPLMYSVSDAEFSGILIDSAFFSNLRQTVKDRLSVIEYYFNCIHDSGSGTMNLESYVDVNIWKDRVFAAFSEGLKASMEQESANSEVPNSLSSRLRLSGMSLEELVGVLVESQHPLFQLISEHRSLSKLVPVCSGTLKYRSFNRVKALYNTLGTATGRITLTNPPLQMVPHVCEYIPTPRVSLHEELMMCEDVASRKVLIAQFNTAVDAGDAVEWVRVKSLVPFKKNIVNQDPGESFAADLFAEYSSGKLFKILDRRLDQSFFLNYNPNQARVSERVSAFRSHTLRHRDEPEMSEMPLIDLWRDQGYAYSDAEGSDILQVLIEFHVGGSKSYYTYPADKVFRVQSTSMPPPAELELISESIQIDWIKKKAVEYFNENRVGAEDLSNDPLKSAVTLLYDTIQVRQGFVASDGYIFIGADYCQIELRILAHYCNDPALCQAIIESPDVFRAIASRWKKKSVDEITTEERNTVKQMCYALIYGAGPSLVAEHAHITVESAHSMMEDFLRIFPGISRFIAGVKKKCRSVGCVETLFGRRRVLNDIKCKKKALRGRADRQAVNMLCQGTAADLIKLAMINIHTRLKEISMQSIQRHESAYKTNSLGIAASKGVEEEEPLFLFRRTRHLPGGGLYKIYDDVRPVLQIHDELLFEVRVCDVPKVARVIKECMENAVVLNVPLEVKLSVGPSWGSLEPYSWDNQGSSDQGTSVSAVPPLVRDLFGKDDD